MRKLILVLFWTCLASAQVIVGNFGVNYVPNAPSGNCSKNALIQIVLGAGTVYTCQSGTWTQIVGGGGAINPTNNLIPVRSNATTFIDSPLTVNSGNVTVGNGLRWSSSSTSTSYGGAPWSFMAGSSLINGTTDNLFNYGYNVGTSQNLIDPTKPGMGYQTEVDYNDGVDHWIEHHLDYTFDGITYYRPFIAGAKLNDTTYQDLKLDIGSNINNSFVVSTRSTPILAIKPGATSATNTAYFTAFVVPNVTNTYDLGTASLSWRDGWFTRNMAIGTSGVSSYLAISGLSSQGPNLLAVNNESGVLFSVGPSGAVGFVQDLNFNNNTAIFGSGQSIRISNGNGVGFSSAQNLFWTSTTHAYDTADTNASRIAPGAVGIGTGAQGNTSGLLLSGNKVLLTSDFTDSNASGLQVITGLSFALPNLAKNWSFHCSLTYSEATPIASDQFGVASLTTAPTNLHAWAHVITTEGAAAVQTTGDSGNITSTTPTSIVTFTPVGTGVKQVEIDGSIEVAGSGASTLQFYVTNGTAADVIKIKQDSYCRLY